MTMDQHHEPERNEHQRLSPDRGQQCEGAVSTHRASPITRCIRAGNRHHPVTGAWLCGTHHSRADRDLARLDAMLALAERAEAMRP